MKVLVTICTFLALAAAESQVYPNPMEFYPNQYLSNGIDYYNYNYYYSPYFIPYQDYVATSLHHRGLSKRDAAVSTHAKSYSLRMSNPNGGFYEYNVQVDRDGQGQSYQHHEQADQVGTKVINHGQSGYQQRPAYRANQSKKDRYNVDQSHQQTLRIDQVAEQAHPFVRYNNQVQNAPNKHGYGQVDSMADRMNDDFGRHVDSEAQRQQQHSKYGSVHEKHQLQTYNANVQGYSVVNQRPNFRPAMTMMSNYGLVLPFEQLQPYAAAAGQHKMIKRESEPSFEYSVMAHHQPSSMTYSVPTRFVGTTVTPRRKQTPLTGFESAGMRYFYPGFSSFQPGYTAAASYSGEDKKTPNFLFENQMALFRPAAPFVNLQQRRRNQFQPLTYAGEGGQGERVTHEKPEIRGFEVNSGKQNNQQNHAAENNHVQPMPQQAYQIIEMA